MPTRLLTRNALLAGASLLVFSCEPDALLGSGEDTASFVDGLVLYEDTGDPVPGVEVRVMKDAILKEWPSIVHTTQTDEQGRFHMNFVHESGYFYEVEVESVGRVDDASLRPGENRQVTLRIPSVVP